MAISTLNIERERVVYWKFANAETTFCIYYKYVPPTIIELNVKKIMCL